jgi:periplasmic divalent cation tolerance protein
MLGCPNVVEALLVISNFPNRESAETCARELVEEKLAACVNVLSACQSVYTWKGKVETAREIPLFIKTPKANYEAVEKAIRRLHPYELPEIIAVAIDTGSRQYLDWVVEVSRPG